MLVGEDDPMLVLVGEDGGCGVRLLEGPDEAQHGDDPEQALCHTNNQQSSLLYQNWKIRKTTDKSVAKGERTI